MKKTVLLLLFALACYTAGAQYSKSSCLVNFIPAPQGSLVPDAIVDNAGVLHVVYAFNQNAYYMRSTDNGASFSSPVKVNSQGTVEYLMGERGPKISVGSDGVVHLVPLAGRPVNMYNVVILQGGTRISKKVLINR